MLTFEQILLILIWAILAFIIQPHYLMLRISAKYRNKEWVKFNLLMVHEQLGNTLMPVIDKTISNHLQTFKASLLRPVQAQAAAVNGEIEDAMDEYIDEYADPLAGIKQEAMNKYLKKYPYLAFLPQLMNTQRVGGTDSQMTREGPRRDF